MATSYINFCDNCRRCTDILYIDEITGLELCIECLNDFESDDDGDIFEYNDDD